MRRGIDALGSTGRLTVLAAALAAIMLAVGLSPYDFLPANRAAVDPGAHALVFRDPSFALLTATPVLPVDSWAGLTVLLRLQTLDRPDRSVPVVAEARTGNRRGMIVGQWKSGMVFRFYDPATGRKNEIGVSTVFGSPRPVVIALRSTARDTEVYVDGRLAGRWMHPVRLDAGGRRFSVILGNSAAGKDSWTGRLSAFAIYRRALSPAEISALSAAKSGPDFALFPTTRDVLLGIAVGSAPEVWVDGRRANGRNFVIPDRFRPPHPAVLTPPWVGFKLDGSFISDTLINFFGFLPEGALLMLAFGRRLYGRARGTAATLLSVCACGALSAGIELLQVFLPSRTSSLSDLTLNILGGLAGALSVAVARSRRHQLAANRR